MTNSEEIQENKDSIHEIQLVNVDVQGKLTALDVRLDTMEQKNDGEFLNIQTEAAHRETRLTTAIMDAAKVTEKTNADAEKKKTRIQSIKDKIFIGVSIAIIVAALTTLAASLFVNADTSKKQKDIKNMMKAKEPKQTEVELFDKLESVEKTIITINNEEVKAHAKE